MQIMSRAALLLHAGALLAFLESYLIACTWRDRDTIMNASKLTSLQ